MPVLDLQSDDGLRRQREKWLHTVEDGATASQDSRAATEKYDCAFTKGHNGEMVAARKEQRAAIDRSLRATGALQQLRNNLPKHVEDALYRLKLRLLPWIGAIQKIESHMRFISEQDAMPAAKRNAILDECRELMKEPREREDEIRRQSKALKKLATRTAWPSVEQVQRIVNGEA